MNERKQVLMEEFWNARGVQNSLDLSCEILGNPVALYDTRNKLIAISKNGECDDGPWNELKTSGALSEKTAQLLESVRSGVKQKTAARLPKTEELKYERLYCKLYDEENGHCANLMVVACNNPVSVEMYDTVEAICKQLSIVFQKSKFIKKINNVYQETVVSSILENSVQNTDAAESKLRRLYTNLKAVLYIGVVRIDESSIEHITQIKELFEQTQGEFNYYIYLDSIVIIISTENPSSNVRLNLSALDEILIENGLFVGISSSFSNFFDMRKYYLQALEAINFGMRRPGREHIFLYDDLRFEHLVFSALNDVDLFDYCHPLAREIYEFDIKNNTNYFETTYMFFSTCGNMELSAKKSKMGVGDMRRSIDNIGKLFGIDWTNGDMAFNVYMAMKIIRYGKGYDFYSVAAALPQ